MPYIRTKVKRAKIDFVEPQADQIFIEDIAYSLARTFRFGGHSEETVAQHSCLVAELSATNLAGRSAAEAMLAGLMHDAAEAYIGDIPTPLKRLLGKQVKDIENNILYTILHRYGLVEIFDKYEPMVHWADRIMLYNDALMNEIDVDGDREISPTDFVMLPIEGGIWSIEESETKFLTMFRSLMLRLGKESYLG